VDDQNTRKASREKPTFADQVGAIARRKLDARGNEARSVWSGFGTMGVIGWSVVIPTLLGAVIGLWLDKRSGGGNRWALTLLVAGLSIGCINAWLWVAKEDKAIHDEHNNDGESDD
jgi:ATP synthase protein I